MYGEAKPGKHTASKNRANPTERPPCTGSGVYALGTKDKTFPEPKTSGSDRSHTAFWVPISVCGNLGSAQRESPDSYPRDAPRLAWDMKVTWHNSSGEKRRCQLLWDLKNGWDLGRREHLTSGWTCRKKAEYAVLMGKLRVQLTRMKDSHSFICSLNHRQDTILGTSTIGQDESTSLSSHSNWGYRQGTINYKIYAVSSVSLNTIYLKYNYVSSIYLLKYNISYRQKKWMQLVRHLLNAWKLATNPRLELHQWRAST